MDSNGTAQALAFTSGTGGITVSGAMGGGSALGTSSFTTTGPMSFGAYTGNTITALNSTGTSVDATFSGAINSSGNVNIQTARNLTVGNVTSGLSPNWILGSPGGEEYQCC